MYVIRASATCQPFPVVYCSLKVTIATSAAIASLNILSKFEGIDTGISKFVS